MPDINKKLFDHNLLLTQAYCELQLQNTSKNNAEIFRSINLEYNNKPLFSYKTGEYFETIWQIDPIMGHHRNFYDEIFESQLRRKREIIKSINGSTKFSGKILVAEIDYTVVDGASEAETQGFIDINDCPPIDTWFYMLGDKYPRKLFSWIPEKYVSLANKGIEVNCIDCLYWYDDGNSLHSKLLTENYKGENILKNKRFSLSKIIYKVKEMFY